MADIDYAKINEVAESYRADMTAFLRALIKNKGMSCQEEAKSRLIVAEMEKLGYDRTRIDGLGSAIGYLGNGPKQYQRELNVMPQWAGSCWYELRYLSLIHI